MTFLRSFAVGFVTMILFAGCGVKMKSDCPAGPLKEVTACAGKAPALLSDAPSYQIAKGVPDLNLCKLYKKSLGKRPKVSDECNVEQSGLWASDDCLKFKGPESWRCLQCDYVAKGGVHHYLMIAVSEDCKKGLYFSGRQHPTETWTSEIGAAFLNTP